MSKIGLSPIKVPDNVEIELGKKAVKIRVGESELIYNIPPHLDVIQEGDLFLVKRLKEDKKTRSLHGFFRTLLQNAIIGLEKPWEKKLEVVGTGYNVKLQGEDMVFKVGYSHPVAFKKKAGVKYQVEGSNRIVVSGADKQLVGEVAYQIKLIKKPDAYKGKGIRYLGEQLKLKPGKKAKVGTTP